jgi:uncharacterized protein (TIGR02118 family)
VVRLVGLWTKPEDVDGFRQEYITAHFPVLDRLENALDATIAHCIEGSYYQMTEVSFTNLEDMETALATDLGKQVMSSARELADKFGVTLEILVVEEPR